jgi:hypothetical protein
MNALTMKTALFAAALTAVTAAGAAKVLDDLPPVPPTPAAVLELISARPFVLGAPYRTEWREEQPEVAAGYILVLKVDPDLVLPRATPMAVLFVGDQVAERINHGYESGKVIAVVPAPLKDGEVDLDLTKAPIWFGTPQLPEQVSAVTIANELRLARQAGIRPFTKEQVEAAVSRGVPRGEHPLLRPTSRTLLLRAVAPLVIEHSPDERELGEGFLRPTVVEEAEAASKR